MTGGGVYPALAVLQALKNDAEYVLWIGSESGMEESLLSNLKVEFKAIPAAGLHGVGVLSMPGNAIQLIRGWMQAKKIIRDFKPDALFLTGGYISVPVALAARNIPSVVFIPDIEPGLALKTVIRSAEKIAVVSEQSKPYIPNKKVFVTGYPIRTGLKEWNRKAGRKQFGIPEDEKTLLVFGGSKGARSINQALLKALPDLLDEMHIIHISGKDHWETVQSHYEKHNLANMKRYHLFAFLEKKMGAALAAADLVVCRAGASTLGELPYFSLPAILVPYPHAWNYQHQNAEVLTKNGGAVILEDEDLENLSAEVYALMNNKKQLNRMSKAMKRYAKPDAAGKIAKLVRGICSESKKEIYYG
jgi:UDP-N-acetylglucosamine--N-acetylmuramyl-(pentapeptide) pyrophosphoryl-undecaprenol N-acetylglucosamine transferase